MSAQVTVVCPHCGSTGTYRSGFKSGSGTQMAQCRSCKKSFRIYFQSGKVRRVDK